MEKKFLCSVCGKAANTTDYIPEFASKMIAHKLCFRCAHWYEQHEFDKERGIHGYAVIEGHHYALLPHIDKGFKGFYGAKFTIRFNDGFTVTCDNLWHQGEIPVGHWREVFPDNAKFIRIEE